MELKCKISKKKKKILCLVLVLEPAQSAQDQVFNKTHKAVYSKTQIIHSYIYLRGKESYVVYYSF